MLIFFSYHRFEELLRDERVISQEVAASEKKFESWSRLPAAAVESTKAVKKAAKQSSSLPPAIAAFEVRLNYNLHLIMTILQLDVVQYNKKYIKNKEIVIPQ